MLNWRIIRCPHDIIKPFRTKGREKVAFSFRVYLLGLIVIRFIILCTANERYNLVNETIFVHYLFLVYFVSFIYNLYIFRTSPGPSSGGTTVFMRHLVHVILYSWLVCRSICSCNWRNTLKINNAPSWFHLRDYIDMHGQQNIKWAT